MAVVACDIPVSTALDQRLIDTAYFRDAYRVPLAHPHASIIDIFFAIFGHHPGWMKIILIVRNRIASLCGLDAPTASEILNVDIKHRYQIGDKIGVWPIVSISDHELVVGRDNKHLDFRLSMFKQTEGEMAYVIVSTICVVNNVSGKIYLFFIIPFHKWGVRKIIANALKAERL